MKLFVLLIGILLLVASASAWTIDYQDYEGKIEFYDGGVGTAFVEGFPVTSFAWKWVGPCETGGNCGRFEASYFWYKIPLVSNNGVITSPSFPGARLI